MRQISINSVEYHVHECMGYTSGFMGGYYESNLYINSKDGKLLARRVFRSAPEDSIFVEDKSIMYGDESEDRRIQMPPTWWDEIKTKLPESMPFVNQ